MVARLKESTSIKRAFYYNENKLKEGAATLIAAANYPYEMADTNEGNRLKMLEKLAELRPNVKVNCLHISLNFDPSEVLDDEKMKEIADVYMDRIGFGNQPYLVYRHHDAGHPHIHLLTTNIQTDGTKIDLHKLGYRLSEPARKEIETSFGLVKAEESKNAERHKLEAISSKAIYGKTDSKRAMQNVLQAVLSNYQFSSLPELKAILRSYNMDVTQGEEGSRMARNNGLYYRILDEDGRAIGTPIKASAFYMKPTLKNLEQLFIAKIPTKKALLPRVKSTIGLALLRNKSSLEEFKKDLKAKGIELLFRQNTEGRIYGITYIDHKNRTVFNGSELGRELSAKAILEGFEDLKLPAKELLYVTHFGNDTRGSNPIIPFDKNLSLQPISEAMASLWDTLASPEQVYEPMPYELRMQKKKKRKKPRL